MAGVEYGIAATLQPTLFILLVGERAGDAAPDFSAASSWRLDGQDDSKAVERKMRKRKKGEPSANDFIRESFSGPQWDSALWHRPQNSVKNLSHMRRNICR